MIGHYHKLCKIIGQISYPDHLQVQNALSLSRMELKLADFDETAKI